MVLLLLFGPFMPNKCSHSSVIFTFYRPLMTSRPQIATFEDNDILWLEIDKSSPSFFIFHVWSGVSISTTH